MKSQQIHSGTPDVRITKPEEHIRPDVNYNTHRKPQSAQHHEHIGGGRMSGIRVHIGGAAANVTTTKEGPVDSMSYTSGPSDRCRVRCAKSGISAATGKLNVTREMVSRSKPRASTSRMTYETPEAGIHYASPPESTMTTTSTNTGTTTTTRSNTESHEKERQYPCDDPVLGRMVVLLVKGEQSTLGLTVAESEEPGEPPVIASIHPGSVADKSDRLLVGDRLISVETVFKRQPEDINVPGKNVTGPWIRMEIEYELPDLPPAGCSVKHLALDLDTRGKGIGLVLRGGWSRIPGHIRPLTVMRVREDSVAELDGRIKPGDRIVTINNVQTARLTCEEAVKLVDASKSRTRLTVEYNVANFEKDRNVTGAVIVEIEKPGNEDLGISLAPCHEVRTGQNAFYINYMRQGSIADRCGALFVGDRVEAIDDIHVEELVLQEAMRRLKHNGLDRVRLQIVPGAISTADHQNRLAQTRESNRRSLPLTGVQPPVCNSTVQNQSMRSGSRTLPLKVDPTIVTSASSLKNTQCVCEYDAGYTLMEFTPDGTDIHEMGERNPLLQRRGISKSFTSLHSVLTYGADLCRCEEVEVCLEPEEHMGYGLSLCAAPHGVTREAQLIKFPVVEHVEPGGAAYKSGVIQEGDRVITMNGQTTLNRTIEELTREYLLPDSGRRRPPLRLNLVTQYSVADTVIPTAGVFDVKLVRRAASLGINLQASIKKQDGQPLLISKVIPGSVASRSGSICPGDILLAVNGVQLASCSLSEAIRLLQSSEDEIVTLRVQKLVPSNSVPNSDDPLVRSSPDTSKTMLQPVVCKRSDSVPEAQLNQLLPVQGTRKIDEKDHLSDLASTYIASTSSVSGRMKRIDRNQTTATTPEDSCHKPYRSASSDQDEQRVPDIRDLNKQSTHPIHKEIPSVISEEGERLKTMPQPQSSLQSTIAGAHRRLISSPENLSQDENVSIVRVVLRRKSADCPWGIIICGTDDALDAPVFIDSLSPGDPGAMSGLLFPGDRILAINGSALHSGNTLTQAMRMLQTYSDRVILHVARPVSVDEESAGNVPGTGSRSLEEVYKGPPPDTAEQRRELSRKLSLKKVVATSNFSRSFDSATNSVESGGEHVRTSDAVASQTLQDDFSVFGPLTFSSKGIRPKSATSVHTASTNTSGHRQRFRDYGGLSSPASSRTGVNTQVLAHAPGTKICASDGSTKITTPKLSPKITPRRYEEASAVPVTTPKSLPISPRSSSQSLVQWAREGQQDLGLESDPSEMDADAGNAPEADAHHEFYAAFTGYNEIDLDSVQCPGCREAIANELRQQRHQQRRTRVRLQQTRTGTDPVRQRARSYQRGTTSFIRERIAETDRSGRMLHGVEGEFPRATFYCPQQELTAAAEGRSKESPSSELFAPDLDPNLRHSKSDSRIDLAGITVLSGKRSTIPTAKSSQTAATKTSPERKTHVPSKSEGVYSRSQVQMEPTTAYRKHQEKYATTTTSKVGEDAQALELRTNVQDHRVPQAAALESQTRQPSDSMTSKYSSSRSHERGVWCAWIRLTKASPTDSYGIGVSEGISTRGIFVSAIRPNSSAERSGQLHLYDRILMINDNMVEGLSCSEAIGLISRSERCLDLLVQRRINHSRRRPYDVTDQETLYLKAQGIDTSRLSTTRVTTSGMGKKTHKRTPQTNLTLL